ncbi:nucleotidyltransferase domain-containing protein [Candidatus Woesearchaeota archaeon]|nr:nucleotidyltransferase domain-containing protein [Candidatus Woesearchaeota archaeon]
MIKRIKPDKYLYSFIEYCKGKYNNNLLAIVIYGSYAWNYFDKKLSDYDVFVIFNYNAQKNTKELVKKFPKVTLQYFCTSDEIINTIKKGSWAVYITLLKSAKVLYCSRNYKKLIKEISKIDFIKNIKDFNYIKNRQKEELKFLRILKGYKGLKWAFPTIRKRLQFLHYLETKEIVWDINKILIKNKILSNQEKDFVLSLNRKILERSKIYNEKDREKVININIKLNKEILNILK